MNRTSRNIDLKVCLFLISLILLVTSFPRVHTEDTETVRIGIIFPNADWMSSSEPVVPLAEEDINNYMISNEHNYRFEFVYKNAEGESYTHLEKQIELKEEGIDLIIGCPWSGFADLSLPYANENDVLLISTASNADHLAIEGDNLFRLFPTGLNPASAEIIWSQGKKACVIIHDETPFGLDTKSRLAEILGDLGIETSFVTIDQENADFDQVKIDIINAVNDFKSEYSLDEIAINSPQYYYTAVLVNLFVDNEQIKQVTWYGLEPIPYPDIEELNFEMVQVMVYHPDFNLEDSSEYREVDERYHSLMNYSMDVFAANLYDACWMYARSVLHFDSQSFDQVKKAIPIVASTNEGITGTMYLDRTGDRVPPEYTIFGLVEEQGEITYGKFGYYNTKTDDIFWLPSLGIVEAPVNDAIIVEHNGPYNGREEQEIRFSSEGTHYLEGDIYSYKWSFGDGSFSFSQNPIHSYYLQGTYTVKLRVIDSEGAYKTVSTTCVIENPVNLNPVAVAGGPFYCYVNETLVFSSENSYAEDGELVAIQWDFDDGVQSNGLAVSHSFNKRDMYEVTLTVTDEHGKTHQDIAKCYVMSEPSVSIEGPYTRKTGELINFNTLVVFDSFDEENMVEEYEWALEGSFSKSFDQNPSHRFNEIGVYPISVKITDNRGIEYTDSVELNIVRSGFMMFGYEIDLDLLRDNSGWVLGILVAGITILGAGSGAIKGLVSFATQGSKMTQFYEALNKRRLDLQNTYEDDPEMLVSSLLELKDDLLSCLKDKSITIKHYNKLDEKVDEILNKLKKNNYNN